MSGLPENVRSMVGLSGPAFTDTDMGNAARLVRRHGQDLRYVFPWSRWLVWTGKRWRVDDTGEVERLAKETVRSIYAEAGREEDEGRRKALADHARRSEARARVEAMIALARSEPGIPTRADEFDADPWLFNAKNGTVDLRTGELREHRREDMMTKMAGTYYDPQATAPRFDGFLREVFDGDEEVVSFVRRFAGYTATGSTEERVFAILHGSGKNGKSTLVELLRDAMGDYATNTSTETILSRRSEGVGNDVAALKGARFVSAAEVEQGRYLAESKVKNLTGSDTVTARFLYGEPFDFRPQFKLWVSTNNRPVIRGSDDAIWDRIRLIPFEQRFSGDHCDPKLPEKLREELPGVLAWMVQGSLEWRRTGLGEPDKVVEATRGYRSEMDVLAQFIEERCVVREGVWAWFSDLWNSYHGWCEEAREKPETKRGFGTRLKERGFGPDRGTGNVPIRRGIALRDDQRPDPEGDPRVTTVTTVTPTVTGEKPHTYEESSQKNYRGYPNYPANYNSAHDSPRVESFQTEGNYSNYGNSEDEEAAYDLLVEARTAEMGRCTGRGDCLCAACLPY